MKLVPLPENSAVCLVYLKDGFVLEGDKFENRDKYEFQADTHGGHIGIVSDLYAYAEWIEEHLETHYKDAQDWCGVFHYEVTEDLGKWLFENPDAFLDNVASPEFIAHATSAISRWFVTGRLTR